MALIITENGEDFYATIEEGRATAGVRLLIACRSEPPFPA